MTSDYISYLQIAEHLNISDDDIILISSDLTNLVYKAFEKENEFDINKFIESFQKKLLNGTLIIPAFTDNLKSGDIFDIKKTKPNTGAISNAVFKHADFIRTYDPLHSFFVLGKHQNEIKSLNDVSTFGANSVFAYLSKNKAKILHIDVDFQSAFTFAHFIEESEKVKYRKFKEINLTFIDENEKKSERKVLFFKRKAGFVNCLNKLEKIFDDKNISSTTIINSIPFKLIEVEKAILEIQKDIKENKARNISEFSILVFVKEFIKKVLK